jgi:hypothetical protein
MLQQTANKKTVLFHTPQLGALYLLLWVCTGVSAQTLKEETRLLDKPSGAQQSPSLAAGSPIKVLERQGFWLRIQVGGASGWAKASSVVFSSGTSGPIVIETGRSGGGNIVASSAARGLSAKDLMNGEPRMDEVEKLSKFSINDPKEVSTFVAQGRMIFLAQNITLKTPEPKTPNAAIVSSSTGDQVAPQRQQKKKGDDDW